MGHTPWLRAVVKKDHILGYGFKSGMEVVYRVNQEPDCNKEMKVIIFFESGTHSLIRWVSMEDAQKSLFSVRDNKDYIHMADDQDIIENKYLDTLLK